MWCALIATRCVDIAVPPPARCAAWARKRLSTAAHRLAHIRPSAMCALAVPNSCRFAYDFHSLQQRSSCQRTRYSRETRSTEKGVRGRFVQRRVIAAGQDHHAKSHHAGTTVEGHIQVEGLPGMAANDP